MTKISRFRSLLLGDPTERRPALLAIVVGSVATYLGYASGVFAVAGGVVWIPGDAALLGGLLAGVLGYRGAGVLLGWLAPYGTLFAFNAEWAFRGLSGRSLGDRLAFLVDPQALAVFALMAIVIGSLGYAAGAVLARVVDSR